MLPLLLFASGFLFSEVEAWKPVEGREDRIPALSAKLNNATGEDWREARFRVTVACHDGGERAYEVLLRDVVRGEQQVRETAFDALDRVAPCDGPARVGFVSGQAVPVAERSSYVILGFAFRAGEGPPSLDLEGLLEFRRHSDSSATTTPNYWRGRGRQLAAISDGETNYYAFRVSPGHFGLAGFLLNRDPLSAIPSRFLRVIEIPPDTAAFLGAFRIERTSAGLVSLLIDPADAAWNALRSQAPLFPGRRWVRPPILTQSPISSIVRE
jgi:hypothetical protein